MKKIISLLLVFIMLLSFIGCKSKGGVDADEELAVLPGAELQSEDTETKEEIQEEIRGPVKEEIKEPIHQEPKEPVKQNEEQDLVENTVIDLEKTEEVYTEPPVNEAELKVLPKATLRFNGQEGIKTYITNYDFTYTDENGEKITVKREGVSPLMHKDDMSVLEMTAPDDAPDVSFWADVSWDEKPYEFSARCWSTDNFEKPDSKSMKANTGILESDGPSGWWTEYEVVLNKGDYVYEVTAEWKYNDDISGTVSYCFYTERNIEE